MIDFISSSLRLSRSLNVLVAGLPPFSVAFVSTRPPLAMPPGNVSNDLSSRIDDALKLRKHRAKRAHPSPYSGCAAGFIVLMTRPSACLRSSVKVVPGKSFASSALLFGKSSVQVIFAVPPGKREPSSRSSGLADAYFLSGTTPIDRTERVVAEVTASTLRSGYPAPTRMHVPSESQWSSDWWWSGWPPTWPRCCITSVRQSASRNILAVSTFEMLAALAQQRP
mmetsp:Transcript_10706/g.31917  ORF Transcript_10706/g.31917 Transcript_10706/m.31917 type:complete len:224 (-) Transcript_10706:170-841(-)